MLEITKQKIVRPYEAIVIMRQDSTEEEQKALFKKNKEIIESFGGEFNHVDSWGSRQLANPIGKTTRAVYFHSTFTAEPTVITELERTMKINEKVLRYVHTRLTEKIPLAKYLENFKEALVETQQREREREAKFKARKAAKSSPRAPRD